MKKIITISRKAGSGGHEIAELLAEKLNIPLHDRNKSPVWSNRYSQILAIRSTSHYLKLLFFTPYISSHFTTPLGVTSIPILQMRSLRLREGQGGEMRAHVWSP